MKQRNNSKVELLLLPIGFLLISIGAGGLLRLAGVASNDRLFTCCWIFPAVLIAGCLVLLSETKMSSRERTWLQLVLAWLMAPATGIPHLTWTNSWPLLVSALGTTLIWEYLRNRADSNRLKEITR
jgi:hypothetical protein